MIFRFNTQYRSIREFPEIALPSFTLITGPNGAGKTHLLSAIREGHVSASGAKPLSNEIRMFDWTNLALAEGSEADSNTLLADTQKYFDEYEAARKAYEQVLLEAAREAGLPAEQTKSTRAVGLLSEEEIARILGDREKAKEVHAKLREVVSKVEGQMRQKLYNAGDGVTVIAQRVGVPFVSLDREHFFDSRFLSLRDGDLFTNNLSRICVAFRDIYLANQLAQYQQHKGRHVPALTDAQFTEKYNTPPWEFLNTSLGRIGLPFRLETPDLDNQTPYRARLVHLRSGAEVKFEELSSGERVLLALSISVYKATSGQNTGMVPKLLLLDEIDATLHPSMARSALGIITDLFVGQLKVEVIATTHSPSTVALAPESALFAMEIGQPGLRKITKARALNILTAGVSTLALTYEGRRQVFVESRYDAEVYTRLYDVLKVRLASDRSLEFVATSSSSGGGDKNSGSSAVNYLVKELRSAGNTSVFGLLDWDGKNEPGERIVIGAYRERDGLENIVFDPLIVAAALLHESADFAEKLGLPPQFTYLHFVNATVEQLADAVSAVQAKILGAAPTKFRRVSYVGGFSLEIAEEVLIGDDHEFQEKVLKAYPMLNAYSRGNLAKLMLRIVEKIAVEKPEFLPAVLIDTFMKLLEAEAHI